MTTWILGEPGGPAGPFWSIVSSSGEVIALQIPSKANAERIIADYEHEQQANVMGHEFGMSLVEYIPQASIVEELRLLADSMSSQKALADKIDISESYLCDILQGRRNPGPKVCEFLKVDPELVYKERR